MPPPQDTSPAAPASTLPDRPPAAAVPPSVAQTCAAPPGCLSECRAHPRAGPLAATPAAARPASNTPRNCSSDNSATPLRARATSTAPDSNRRLRTAVADAPPSDRLPTVHGVVRGTEVLKPNFARQTVPCSRIRSVRPRVKRQLTNSRDSPVYVSASDNTHEPASPS